MGENGLDSKVKKKMLIQSNDQFDHFQDRLTQVSQSVCTVTIQEYLLVSQEKDIQKNLGVIKQ